MPKIYCTKNQQDTKNIPKGDVKKLDTVVYFFDTRKRRRKEFAKRTVVLLGSLKFKVTFAIGRPSTSKP